MSTTATETTGDIISYINANFSVEDEFLKKLLIEATGIGMPEISISSQQGAFLQFLLRTINAKYVLEIGSLGGYSAITMARVLPDDGKLTAVEMETEYAEFIQKKAKEAGLSDKIEVVNDTGIGFLKKFKPDHQFDFIFIDAEKTEYSDYFDLAVPYLRKGGIFAADNALAFGEVANPHPLDGHHSEKDILAIRAFNTKVKADTRFFTILLPIGDGLLLAVKL
jgi:caffeoyl-CoA O-methyltransferase